MDKIKKYLPYILIALAVFYLGPLVGDPRKRSILLLVKGIPGLMLLLGGIYGSNHGKDIWFPIILTALYLPSVLIYHDKSAFIYAVIYLVSGYLGTYVGEKARLI